MSMRSDASMHHPLHFKSGDTQTDLRYNISIKNIMAFYSIRMVFTVFSKV